MAASRPGAETNPFAASFSVPLRHRSKRPLRNTGTGSGNAVRNCGPRPDVAPSSIENSIAFPGNRPPPSSGSPPPTNRDSMPTTVCPAKKILSQDGHTAERRNTVPAAVHTSRTPARKAIRTGPLPAVIPIFDRRRSLSIVPAFHDRPFLRHSDGRLRMQRKVIRHFRGHSGRAVAPERSAPLRFGKRTAPFARRESSAGASVLTEDGPIVPAGFPTGENRKTDRRISSRRRIRTKPPDRNTRTRLAP